MTGLITNETYLLNKFKNDNILECNTFTMISILIKKYYLDGLDKDSIYKTIMDDLNIYFGNDFIYTNWDANLKKWIKRFYRNLYVYKAEVKLIDIESILITKKELEKISSLNNLILEKLAFILLVYAKVTNTQFQKTDGWVNKSSQVICKEAHVDLRGNDQRKIFYELNKLKFISNSTNNEKTSIKVEFVDCAEDSEIAFEINDFDEVIYLYLIFKGQQWIRCEKCNKWIVPKNNKTKYCVKCAKEVKLENDRQIQQKRYNSRK